MRAAIRGEQLRLVLAGVAQSFPVGFLLSSLLVIVVDRIAPLGELLAWYATFLAVRIGTVVYARYVQQQPRRSAPPRSRTAERILMILKIAEGCCWGALLWIGLGSSEPAINVLLLALMCAICGNSVSLLSPLRDLYLALVLPVLLVAFARLWLLGGLILSRAGGLLYPLCRRAIRTGPYCQCPHSQDHRLAVREQGACRRAAPRDRRRTRSAS